MLRTMSRQQEVTAGMWGAIILFEHQFLLVGYCFTLVVVLLLLLSVQYISLMYVLPLSFVVTLVTLCACFSSCLVPSGCHTGCFSVLFSVVFFYTGATSCCHTSCSFLYFIWCFVLCMDPITLALLLCCVFFCAVHSPAALFDVLPVVAFFGCYTSCSSVLC